MEIVSNGTILYKDDLCELSYKRGCFLCVRDKDFFKMAIPLNFWKKICASFRLTERFLRLTPRCFEKIDANRFLISYSGGAYCLDFQQKRLTLEHRYCPRMNNPLYFTRIEGISGFTDGILYGEYPINPQRNPISIFRRNNDGKWNKVYTFNGNILHIHNIIPDKRRSCVYILTGDEDKESGIWKAKNDFREVYPIVIGSQKYRSCIAFPVKDGLIYATDTPLESNAIFFLDVETKRIEKITNISGACIYGTEKNGKIFLTADVEPDSRLHFLRYWITYRLGSGIKDRQVRIYFGNNEIGFDVIAHFDKDYWPMTMFQFGNVSYPKTGNCDVLCVPTAVKKYDGKTILLKSV